jgi:hypothetical protein
MLLQISAVMLSASVFMALHNDEARFSTYALSFA